MRTSTTRLSLQVDDEHAPTVSAVVHEPSRPRGAAVLLVHGAGGDLDGEGLTALCEGLAQRGHLAVRANLPFREAGRGRPPKAERTVASYRRVLAAARSEVGPRRDWIVGGKSYGGRVASLAAADGMDCAGLVFYGYPLHPPGKPERLRVDHWPRIQVPCLFLQGTRDGFCELDLLDANLRKLPRRATVEVVEGGDHSLRVAGKHAADGRPHPPPEVLAGLADLVADWIEAPAAGRRP